MLGRAIKWTTLAGLGVLTAAFVWATLELRSLEPPNWDEVKERIRREFPDVSHVELGELDKWLRSSNPRVVLVDVRAPEEISVSRIPGSVAIPEITPDAINQLKGMIQSRSPEAGPASASEPAEEGLPAFVFYCSVGYRSAEAAREAQRLGLKNVHNFLGSIFAWANDDRELVAGDDDGPSRSVHPFNTFWGRLLREDLHDRPR